MEFRDLIVEAFFAGLETLNCRLNDFLGSL